MPIAKLAKQIEAANATQQAILDKATAEDRADLTADEKAEFDLLTEKKSSLKDQIKRYEQLDADKTDAAKTKTAPIVQLGGGEHENETIYATPHRHNGRLMSFKGPDAAKRAHTAGMWAAATLFGNQKAKDWCKNQGLATNGYEAAFLNTGIASGAGYLVPDVMEFAVAELMLEYGVFRQLADVVNMTSLTWSGPRRAGAMTAYFVAEGSAPTQSDPKWDQIKLVAQDLGAFTKLSRDLNEDSAVNIGDKITMELALAFATKEDQCGFNGDGTSTYGGMYGLRTKILATSAAYITAAAGNTTPDLLDLADFTKCQGALPMYAGMQPAWIMHPQVYANSMANLMLGQGGNTVADIQAGTPRAFLGSPVVLSNAMPTFANSTTGTLPILYGDVRMSSKMGVRRGITVESGLINDDFTKGLITILGTERFQINNHTIVDPVTADYGPVVGLKLA